jgi:hypothetical protein
MAVRVNHSRSYFGKRSAKARATSRRAVVVSCVMAGIAASVMMVAPRFYSARADAPAPATNVTTVQWTRAEVSQASAGAAHSIREAIRLKRDMSLDE